MTHTFYLWSCTVLQVKYYTSFREVISHTLAIVWYGCQRLLEASPCCLGNRGSPCCLGNRAVLVVLETEVVFVVFKCYSSLRDESRLIKINPASTE